jgi:hypothetical protein
MTNERRQLLAFWLLLGAFVLVTMPWWCRPSW